MGGGWCQEMVTAKRSVEDVRRSLMEVERWVWEHVVAQDVWPRELPPDLAKVIGGAWQALEDVEREVDSALERYSVRPARKYLAGVGLTREEFYLLCSSAGRPPLERTPGLGLASLDDSELFSMFWFESDTRYGYINPGMKPNKPFDLEDKSTWSGRVGGYGVAPEDVPLSCLRPEQQLFFRETMPEVYARFKREMMRTEGGDRPPGT